MSKKDNKHNVWEDTAKGALAAGSAGGAVGAITAPKTTRVKLKPGESSSSAQSRARKKVYQGIGKAYKKKAIPAALAGGYATFLMHHGRKNKKLREKKAGEDMSNKYLEKIAEMDKEAFAGLVGKVVGSKSVGKAVNAAGSAASKAKGVASNAAKNYKQNATRKSTFVDGALVGGLTGSALSGSGKKKEQEKKASVTAVSALRRLAQKKKKNPILDKAFQKAHAKAKIYK